MDAAASAQTAAIAARAITKRFPGVVANDAVDLEVGVGEVHALLGENGSGKTTLCNMLTGLYRPDGGQIEVQGVPARFESPRDAYAAGIFMVHQHFSLVDRLTVAENVVLGWTGPHEARFDPRDVEREVASASEELGLAVDPRAFVWQLSVGERQRVEILKALYRRSRVLILDEPTTVLTPQECDRLFEDLRRLAAGGASVILISHKLPEIIAACDRVTVLRQGRSVAVQDLRDGTVDASALVRDMVGHEVSLSRRQRSADTTLGAPVLEVAGVSSINDLGQPAPADLSLTLHAGEIVGVAGVAGNGQHELAETVTGLRPLTAGSVSVAGTELPSGQPRAAMRAGVSYIPQDRLGQGLAPGLSVADNVMLKDYDQVPYASGPLLRLQKMRHRVRELLERFDVRGATSGRVGQLSGGNAQKVVLARELSREPRVVIAESPTRGLDIGATEAVRQALVAAADGGAGVILISEDLDEVMDMSDRIAVMFAGRLVGLLDAAASPERERIGRMMAGMEG